jgi:hypothetical protein
MKITIFTIFILATIFIGCESKKSQIDYRAADRQMSLSDKAIDKLDQE